jgi:hypothetical protein
MTKKICLVIVVCLLSIAVNAQEWVNFGNRAEGAPPESCLNYVADQVRNDNMIYLINMIFKKQFS